jgi:Protein of unknown function (DUF2752)
VLLLVERATYLGRPTYNGHFLLPWNPAVNYPPAPAAPAPGPALRGVSASNLRVWQRLVLVFAGTVLVGLLATAACLTPSSRGYGTHQGLGLPPCTIVQIFGVRCPSCGMTTSWAHMTRGHVVQAVRANAGGALLAILAASVGPWILASGLVGRWLGGEPRESITILVGVAVVVTTLIDWSLRLSWGG